MILFCAKSFLIVCCGGGGGGGYYVKFFYLFCFLLSLWVSLETDVRLYLEHVYNEPI